MAKVSEFPATFFSKRIRFRSGVGGETLTYQDAGRGASNGRNFEGLGGTRQLGSKVDSKWPEVR
jgi:hypothetical protein